MGAKGPQGYVEPVTAHVIAAEYSRLTIINQVSNLSAYARQLKIIKCFMGILRVHNSPCSHVG